MEHIFTHYDWGTSRKFMADSQKIEITQDGNVIFTLTQSDVTKLIKALDKWLAVGVSEENQ